MMKNVAILMSGTIIAQVISFLASMVLSRLYSPDDFGVLVTFTAIAGFIAVFATGKYDLAIVTTKKEEHVIRLIRLCFFLVLLTGFIVQIIGAAFYFFPDLIGDSSEAVRKYFPILPVMPEKYSNWNLFFGPAIFLFCMVHVYWMHLTRIKKFKELSAARIMEAVFNNGMAIGFYFTGAAGLLVGYFSAQVVMFGYLHSKSSRIIPGFSLFSSGSERKEIAKEYKEFPRVNIFQGLIDHFQMQGVILIGSTYFVNSVMGFYSMSMRVLQVPMWLIIRPLSHAFFSEASELHRNGKSLLPVTKKMLLRSALLGIPMVLVLVLFGPALFVFFFGEEWRASGELARILSFWIYVDFLRAPISQVPMILGRQRLLLAFSIAGLIIMFAAILIAGNYYSNDLLTAFKIITAGQIVYSILVIFISVLTAKNT
jgi:lipopolysaccharide exporter